MSHWLHSIDVWLYQLLSQMWHLYAPIGAVVLALTLIERHHPVEPVQPWRTLRFNLAWHTLVLALYLASSWTIWGDVIVWLTGPGPALFTRLPAPDSITGEIARTALAIVVYDFFSYWAHRLQHASGVFWAVHQFHHEERSMSSASSLRAHWLNVPFTQIFVLVPMMWLIGLDAMPYAAFLFIGIFSALSHSNMNVSFGAVGRILVSPRYHRLHHARARHLHDHNFAALLPLWDHLFGTYLPPDPARQIQTGVEGVVPTSTYGSALLQPIAIWHQMLRRRAARV